MNTIYQFAPIRTYSGAKSNKKTKAITEFVKQLFDRHYFDRTYTNRDAIVKAVQKECDILDAAVVSSIGKLRASSTSTNEHCYNDDWKLSVDYIKESGEVIQVCEILCFHSLGGILDKAVDYASESYGKSIRQGMGI